MYKKALIIGLLVGLLFCSNGPALALSFEKLDTSIEPSKLEIVPDTTKKLIPLLPAEPEAEPEPDRVMATSTYIGDEPSEPEAPPSADFESPVAGEMEIDRDDETPAEPETAEENSATLPEVPRVVPQPELTTEPESVLFEVESEGVNDITAVDKPLLELDVTQIDVGAELFVCNLDNGCSGDVGLNHWMSEAVITLDSMDRELKFQTKENKIKSGLLQIAYTPFAEDTKIVYSKNINTGASLFDFWLVRNLVSSQPQNDQINENSDLESVLFDHVKTNEPVIEAKVSVWSKIWNGVKSFFKKPLTWVKMALRKNEPKAVMLEPNMVEIVKMQPKVFYLRVLPTESGRVVGKASNQVKVSIEDRTESEFEFYVPPKIFEVKIKDFEPIRSPEPGVCHGAMILDTDWVKPKIGGGAEVIKAGTRVCPAPYKGIGEASWYESLWNAAKSGVDWISKAYNELKSAVVDTVAGMACGGDEYCKMAISAGLDAGLMAMGVPPTLPNFDELVDGGFDYLASEIAVQAGCPDVACKELVKKNLKTALESNKNTNPNCKGEEEAHDDGLEPLCLPANVKAHLDPLGTYRSAQVTLEVRRNFLDGPETGVMGVPYRLFFNNLGYNNGLIGSWIRNIPPYGKDVEITGPLQGQMFENKIIEIPHLEKGEIIEVPIVLAASEYWIPGHLEAMEGWTTVTYKDGWPQYQYDDWWKLYYDGTLAMSVAIDACEQSYGMSSCILSSDSMTVDLPNTLNP